MMDDYKPVIYKIPDLQDDIYKTKIDPVFSEVMCYPKFSYGFQHFIHQSKGNMSVTDQFEGKKKVYYVMSKFEKHIDNYDQDLAHISRIYFDVDPKPDLICRALFKIWEIFFLFDNVVPINSPDFVSAHLAEGPGSFIQATMLYRDKFCKKGVSKNDKYYGITLHAESENTRSLALEEKFTSYYEKEKPLRFVQHKTYPKKEAEKSSNKDNGDLTDLKTIKLFSEHFNKHKAHLVTADGGFDWKNENLQEQEAFPLILGEVITALNIQEKNGVFILKIYESFTDITVKLMCILKSFYKDVYVVKPLTSRKSNSEKYLVCTQYNGSSHGSVNEKKIRALEELLHKINTSQTYINDIFPEYILNKELMTNIISFNTLISNRQFQNMNEIINFINKQNYRGDEYQTRRNMQIEATKYWINNFYPDIKDFDKNKKEMETFAISIINDNNKNLEKLMSKLA